jgi:hypothetical protein
MSKQAKRDRSIQIRVSEKEHAAIVKAADKRGYTTSQWIRGVLLAIAFGPSIALGCCHGMPETGGEVQLPCCQKAPPGPEPAVLTCQWCP